MFSGETIGFIAGTLTTVAFVPQVYKTWKTKSAKDVSLIMFVIFSIGVMCWLVYGITFKKIPIIMSNSAILTLSAIQIILKIRYDNEKGR